LALVHEGDSITIDAGSIAAIEFPARRTQPPTRYVETPEPRYRSGVLAKYVRLVSSSRSEQYGPASKRR